MGIDDDPFKPNPSEFRVTPASRVIGFLMGLMFLVVHGIIWQQVLTDSPMRPENAEHEPVVFLGLAGKTLIFLGVTGAFSLLMFWLAFHREWRPDTADPDPTVPLAGDGIATPSGVPTEPMAAGMSGSSAHRIIRRGRDVLVIGPSRDLYALVSILFGMAAVLWFFTWMAFVGVAQHPLVTAGGGLFCFGLGCLVIWGLSRHFFDKGRGEYRRSNAIFRWPIAIPLWNLRAVQLLTDIPRELKDGEKSPRRYVAFQVNLVLQDLKRPRRHLFEDSNRDSAVRIARELAGFLGLPLYRTAMPRGDAAPNPDGTTR